MINVKITFMHVVLRINWLKISSVSQILQKLLGELIFEKSADIGSAVVFLANETLSCHNTCQNHPQIFQKL